MLTMLILYLLKTVKDSMSRKDINNESDQNQP
jgi:hypothetical protein